MIFNDGINFEDPKAAEDAWRIFRIMAETVRGFEVLRPIGPSVSIFGSARTGAHSQLYKDTEEIAHKLSKAGFGIITGGGPGLMEAGNKGATEAGGESVGLHIHLPHEQSANSYIKTQVDFRYFFLRKLMFVKYAQAYVVMPGGMGTIDELAEAFVLMQTKRIRPFPIVLYGSQFWSGLLDWVSNTMVDAGCINKDELDLLTIKDTPDEVVDYLTRRIFTA